MWHIVASNGNTEGPYPEDQMTTWYEDGTITENTFVWRKGQGDWKKLADTPDLLATIHGVPDAPPPARDTTTPDPAVSSAAAAVAAALADDEPAVETATPEAKKKLGLKSAAAESLAKPAPQEMANCPKCGQPRPLSSPFCQNCTVTDATSNKQSESNAFANLAKSGIIQKDLTKWGWMLMGFGVLNLLMAFMSAALAGDGLGILIIKIFSVAQILAGLLTIIIYKRFMYIVIISMTLVLAVLNGLCGAFLLAGIQGFYGIGLIRQYIRTRPKPV